MSNDLFPGFSAGKIDLFKPDANTVEGKKFFEDYCDKCGWKAREPGEEECGILANGLSKEVNDLRFPHELIYQKIGMPDEVKFRVLVCTKFRLRLV